MLGGFGGWDGKTGLGAKKAEATGFCLSAAVEVVAEVGGTKTRVIFEGLKRKVPSAKLPPGIEGNLSPTRIRPLFAVIPL